MHVAFVNYFCDTGITDPVELLSRYRTQTEWCAQVRELGVRVSVIQRFPSDLHEDYGGVEYHFVAEPGVRFVDSASRINVEASRSHPDLFHIQGLSLAPQAAGLKRLLPRTPVLVQDHADRPRRNPLVRRAMRQAFSKIDAVSFASLEQAEPWRRAGVLTAQSRIVSLNESSCGFRLAPRAEARAATGLCGSPQLLWVGRLNANKDPLTVVSGFARVLRDARDARLAMAYTDTTLLSQLKQWLGANPNVAGRVDLLGHVPRRRMELLFNSADIFVLGSDRNGGTGYSLLEALACGVTPVVTDLPSFVAITGPFGFHWRAGSSEECANAVIEAWQARSEQTPIDIRAYFDSCLSPVVLAKRAVAVYRSLVQDSST